MIFIFRFSGNFIVSCERIITYRIFTTGFLKTGFLHYSPGCLGEKVYEGGWQASTEQQLINRMKLKEFDLNIVKSLMAGVKAKLRKIDHDGIFAFNCCPFTYTSPKSHRIIETFESATLGAVICFYMYSPFCIFVGKLYFYRILNIFIRPQAGDLWSETRCCFAMLFVFSINDLGSLVSKNEPPLTTRLEVHSQVLPRRSYISKSFWGLSPLTGAKP
ncbi:hypothetical protein BpHYR1_047645 [Brachionus plicatilis]|uniref:Uncharacterized protein n=1 Tax=Brachionus plicatilis TaxID=10195 RepID=A0A3M7RY18_BRAPC|nr:hypothetical protein BpHYR1_047645 [Brachionus plicatilis]